MSVLLAVALEILIYPVLAWAEHWPGFSSFVNERKGGEFKHSLLLAFTMLAVCNTICWRKYTRLNRAQPNAILAVQARLYRAKSLVDTCVTIALLAVALMPESPLAFWLDLVGSLIVAAYLTWCGIRTIWENRRPS